MAICCDVNVALFRTLFAPQWIFNSLVNYVDDDIKKKNNDNNNKKKNSDGETFCIVVNLLVRDVV